MILNVEILNTDQSIFDIPLSKWRTKIGYVMQSNSMMRNDKR